MSINCISMIHLAFIILEFNLTFLFSYNFIYYFKLLRIQIENLFDFVVFHYFIFSNIYTWLYLLYN